MSFKSLDKLLNSNGADPLENLVQRAQQMDALVVRLRHALPGPGSRELLSANIRDDGELVVVCSNSAWAARLRFESATLIAAARQHGHDVVRCSVRVERQ